MSAAEVIAELQDVSTARLNLVPIESAPQSADSALDSLDVNTLEMTPTDELTGLPLSVFIEASYFSIEGRNCTPEFHHRQHPSDSPELGNNTEGDLLPAHTFERTEGLAVRYSSGEILPSWLHDLYHDLFFGPTLPRHSRQKHSATILGLANVLPRQSMHIYEPGNFRLLDLNNGQHELISRHMHHEGANYGMDKNRRGRIGSYLGEYAILNHLGEIIHERQVSLAGEEFLEIRQQLSDPRALRWEEDELRKGEPTPRQLAKRRLLELGESIVRQALRSSVEGVIPLFNEAVMAGMVQSQRSDLGQIAIKFFGAFSDRPEFPAKLEKQLVALDRKPLQTEVKQVPLVA